jgi:hypothetical protein
MTDPITLNVLQSQLVHYPNPHGTFIEITALNTLINNTQSITKLSLFSGFCDALGIILSGSK